MTEPVTIIMFGEPVGFARTRPNPHGALFTPRKQRVNAAMIRLQAQEVMAGRPLLDGPVSLGMVCRFAVPRSWSKKRRTEAVGKPVCKRPDIDNCLKQVTDALNRVVYRDDAQIAHVSILKTYGIQPMIIITAEEISPTATTTAKPTPKPTAAATDPLSSPPAAN